MSAFIPTKSVPKRKEAPASIPTKSSEESDEDESDEEEDERPMKKQAIAAADSDDESVKAPRLFSSPESTAAYATYEGALRAVLTAEEGVKKATAFAHQEKEAAHQKALLTNRHAVIKRESTVDESKRSPIIVAAEKMVVDAKAAADKAFQQYQAVTDVFCTGCESNLKGVNFKEDIFRKSQKERSPRYKAQHGEYKARCITCESLKQRSYKPYGDTPEAQKELLNSQGGKCGVCDKLFTSTKVPHLDHNHTTGLRRGFLCGSCNLCIRSEKGKEMGVLKALQIAKYLLKTDSASISAKKERIRIILKEIEAIGI